MPYPSLEPSLEIVCSGCFPLFPKILPMPLTRTQRARRTQRRELKASLLQHIRALDPQTAILPAPHPTIDQLIHQLEDLNPTRQPLSTEFLSTLVGNWTLIYASQGTVLTRRLDPQTLPVRIQRVWQRLSPAVMTPTQSPQKMGQC